MALLHRLLAGTVSAENQQENRNRDQKGREEQLKESLSENWIASSYRLRIISAIEYGARPSIPTGCGLAEIP